MSREYELVSALEELGVEVRRTTGDEINARCPVHVRYKGRESEGFHFYMNAETGLWHCFTCGARGNLSILLSELAADPSQLWHVQKTLIKQGLERALDQAPQRDPAEPQVDWFAYGQFAELPERYLELRHISPEAAKRYGVRWDPKKKMIINPIISPEGDLKGWQAKRQSDKLFLNTPDDVKKSETLFGIERVIHPTGLLLESPLDVVRWYTLMGHEPVSAVSSFGASVSDIQMDILHDAFDTLILALDNDSAGINETRRLAGRGKYPVRLTMRKPLKYWSYSGTKAKDIGDMTDDEVHYGYQRVSTIRSQ